MMNYLFLALLILLAIPAKADHESAETILGQVTQHASRIYTLKPAQKVRELPITSTTGDHPLKADLVSLSKGVFSVLMVENGSLVSESYANGAAAHTPVNLYSATKSFTSLAVGEALCAGKINSLDDPASNYAASLQGTAYGAASIRNLLGYTSGAKDTQDNGYSGIHVGKDFSSMMRQEISLVDLMKRHGEPSSYKPGEKFNYNGLNSEALSLVVHGATGMPLPQWFESTVWQKSGGEYAAAWFTDKNGDGVAEALAWTTTRDFLRVGIYTLERLTGKSNDACMNAFVKEASAPRSEKSYWKSAPFWGLGLHVGADKNIWFIGHGAQRVGINQKTGRILAINGFSEWRGMDTDIQRLFNR
jgi:CubicO group peptidase (beta-lactamase class C family)